MFTNDGINLYMGDMVQGDREATSEEIALYEANRLEALKPKVLTPKQARLALLGAGLYDSVNQAVKLNPAHEIYWEYALEVRRDDTLLIELSTALAITSEQLDGLFELGSTL